MADPLEEYNRIICTRQRNPLTKGGELHHIIPRACGGSDKKWNLVRLTCEEHYKVHELLPYIYTHGVEHRAMVFAWHLMKGAQGHEIDCEKFEELKASKNKLMSEMLKGKKPSQQCLEATRRAHTGKPAWNKGRAWTAEERKKLSEACKGKKKSRYVHTPAFWAKQAAKKGKLKNG